MHILVTAFEPFDGAQKNSALEAVKLLPSTINGHTITKLKIPTVFQKSINAIISTLESTHFDAVLAIGQASGRSNITLERIGINIDDARIPDNDGNQPIDVPIQSDGASAYFSNLPVKRMTQAINEAGIPASLSNSAGTFVCNHVLYQLGYLHETKYTDLKFGFIHVPYLAEQTKKQSQMASMSLSSIVKGLEAAISEITHETPDIKASLGENH